MNNCIFCKIINKEIASNIVYEDEFIIVFMDLNPDSNGHMLIVPKKHITDFTEMDNETLSHINEVAKKMHKLVMEKLKPEGIKLTVNYGFIQVVKHYHLHLIPIYKNKQPLKDIKEIYNILSE